MKKFFKVIFIIIFSIIIFAAISVISVFLLLLLKFDVNLITVTGAVKKIDTSYTVETDITDSDLSSFESLVNDTEVVDDFSAKYIAAYLRSVTVSDEFELITLDLNGDNFTSIVKFDTTNLIDKIKKIDSVADKVPNPMYIETTSKIEVVDNSSYSVSAVSMKIQNLSAKETKNICNVFAIKDKEYGYEKLNEKINCQIVDYIFGDKTGSVFNILKTHDASSFGIDITGDTSYFSFYYIALTEKWTITYTGVEGLTNPNILEYDITLGRYVLQNLSKDGYEFLGFYEGSNKIVEINGRDTRNYNLQAKWDVIEYNITYHLNGGILSGTNPTTYTVEDDDIEIINPTKEFSEFVGWDDGTTRTNHYVIRKGSIGDITLNAIYQGEVNTLTLVADGITLTSYDINRGTSLDLDKVREELNKVGLTGYNVDAWYNDQLMSDEYTNEVIDSDKFLYGSLNYFIDNIYFYDYLDQFNQALNTRVLHITSRRMLEAYMQYVIFYNVEISVSLYIDYTMQSSEFDSAYSTVTSKKERFQTSSQIQRIQQGNEYKIYVLSSNWDTDASNTMDPTKSEVSEQLAYVFKNPFAQTRANDFENFSINLVAKGLNVTTSTQLFYALENGYRPICGSSLQVLYNKILNILRQNIDDDMTDIEKIDQIYQWIIKNVEYDNKALDAVENNLITNAEALTYKSWYIEGVINDEVAVCEGIAKTFLTMARIEGIPAVYVTGNGHAWNKIYIEGKWYGIDATHGNLSINSQYEVYSYTQFMFTDEYKTSKGYTTQDYSDLVCDTVYDYFENKTYTSTLGEFSLKIDSSNVSKFKNYVNSHKSHTGPYITITVELASGYTFNELYAYCGFGGSPYSGPTTTVSGLNSYIIFIQ